MYGVKIKAIDARLPSALLLCWERLSIKGKVPEGDYMKYTIILQFNEMIYDQWNVCTTVTWM